MCTPWRPARLVSGLPPHRLQPRCERLKSPREMRQTPRPSSPRCKTRSPQGRPLVVAARVSQVMSSGIRHRRFLPSSVRSWGRLMSIRLVVLSPRPRAGSHVLYPQDDGLQQPWPGTVFLNPPYKLPDVARFIGKLYAELDAQRTTAAILLVNNATETDWFQRAFARAEAVCFPDGKIRFVHATHDGQAGPCVGQVLLYYGPIPWDSVPSLRPWGEYTGALCRGCRRSTGPRGDASRPRPGRRPGHPALRSDHVSLGKLCANKPSGGRRARRCGGKTAMGASSCNTEKKRQQYVPRKEMHGD